MGAGGVAAARSADQRASDGASPIPALQNIQVHTATPAHLKPLLVRHHYLHTVPAGTHLAFGVSLEGTLCGALTLGVGPAHAYGLVEGAGPKDCLTLTRLWLSDALPRNSESHVLGIVLRLLRRHTSVKFLLSYADPSRGHLGTIYQAAGWLYTGLSQAMPLYDLGDGKARHSRSLAHAYGTHSVRHFARHGVNVRLVPQAQKHRYLCFLDPAWRPRLRVPVLPYPKPVLSKAERRVQGHEGKGETV